MADLENVYIEMNAASDDHDKQIATIKPDQTLGNTRLVSLKYLVVICNHVFIEVEFTQWNTLIYCLPKIYAAVAKQ